MSPRKLQLLIGRTPTSPFQVVHKHAGPHRITLTPMITKITRKFSFIPPKPRIDIEFQAFSTEFGSDYLLIYDGNETHSRYILSGDNLPPPIRTRGNMVIFRWKTDREISGSEILAQLTPTGRAYKFISRQCYLQTQINTTHPSISLTSPLWPKIYSVNEQCFHNLNVSNAGILAVRFQHFLTVVKVQTLTI